MNLRQHIALFRHRMWVKGEWHSYKMGYLAALDDIERTGLIPKREDAKQEAAMRAVNRLWDEP